MCYNRKLNTNDETKLDQLIYGDKGKKMKKFSKKILTEGGSPLALILQTVTSSFTLITRDENPKALIICGKDF